MNLYRARFGFWDGEWATTRSGKEIMVEHFIPEGAVFALDAPKLEYWEPLNVIAGTAVARLEYEHAPGGSMKEKSE